MSDKGENDRRKYSAGIWIATVAIVLTLYVISPPFVLKIAESVSGGSLPRSSSAFKRAFVAFYWPLSGLGRLGLEEPMGRFYIWEARLIGVEWIVGT